MIDVVIPFHGRLDWLALCLESLARFTVNRPVRVILVDNATPKEELQSLDVESVLAHSSGNLEIDFVHLGENKSFSHAVNAGVAAGRNPYVVILNSDVVVVPGWDACFLGHLQDDAVGLVGARSNYASGIQGTDLKLNPTFLIFFMVALRRKVWEEVGPLDAATFHDWSGGEDIDYSWRVIDHGYGLAVADVKVFHAGSQTYRSTGIEPEKQSSMHAIAEERLNRKWGETTYKKRRTSGLKRVAVGMLSVDERVDLDYMKSMLFMKFMGGPCAEVEFYDVRRMSPGWARQLLAQRAVEDGHDYLLMIDDDMRFPPALLHNLLFHQVEVVAALAYMRKPPHNTVAYRWIDAGEGFQSLNAIEGRGLMKVDAVGMGAVLISTDVFRRMDKPWFRHDLHFGEDLGFCKRAVEEAKAEIFVDTNMVIGHMSDRLCIDQGYVQAYRKSQELQQQPYTAVRI